MFNNFLISFCRELYGCIKRTFYNVRYVVRFNDYSESDNIKNNLIYELNRNSFVLRELFYEQFKKNTFTRFFRSEWALFFKENKFLHKV